MAKKGGKASQGVRLIRCGLLSAAAVPVLGVGAYLLWANWLQPLRKDSRVLPQPNGYDAFLRAARRLPPSVSQELLRSPASADPERIRQVVDRQRPTLNEIRAGFRLQCMVPAGRARDEGREQMDLLRSAARFLAGESRVAHADRQFAVAEARALDAIEFGSRVGNGGGFGQHLIAGACMSIGLAVAEAPVPGLDAQEARAAGQRLDRILAGMPPESGAYREELRQWLGAFHDMAGGRGVGSGRWSEGVAGILIPKSRSAHELNRWLGGMASQAERPFFQRTFVPRPRDRWTARLAQSIAQGEAVFVRRRVMFTLLRLELALQEHRKRTGAYPTSLGKLTPQVLRAVPVDEYSGNPFRYLSDDKGYLLYSTGPNGRDEREGVAYGASDDLVAGQLFPRRNLH